MVSENLMVEAGRVELPSESRSLEATTRLSSGLI